MFFFYVFRRCSSSINFFNDDGKFVLNVQKISVLKKLSLKCTNVLLGYLNRSDSATNNIVFDNSIILGARYLL